MNKKKKEKPTERKKLKEEIYTNENKGLEQEAERSEPCGLLSRAHILLTLVL